jgi:hypothetical protein
MWMRSEVVDEVILVREADARRDWEALLTSTLLRPAGATATGISGVERKWAAERGFCCNRGQYFGEIL